MKKLSKHALILKRRLNQGNELNKLYKIENKVLRQFLTAFKSTKTKTNSTEDIEAFSNCEHYRTKLLTDKTQISYEVFSSDRTASVQDICSKAASSKKWCQFLYHLVKSHDNANILEIGTNLGISGSYFLEALKNKNGMLTTLEGLPQLCEIASNQFSNIVPNSKFEVIQGLYDSTFPKVVENGRIYNLIFIDGNHQKYPTIEYFEKMKSKIGKTAIFVFDDINWSDGMKEAWKVIKADKDVNFSVDMYEQGIVIIDKDERQKNSEFELHLSY